MKIYILPRRGFNVPTFIILNSEERIKLFEELKNKFDTWDKFLLNYKISRPMLFYYKSGKFDIPEELFLKWQKETNISFLEIKKVEKCRYVKKEIPPFNLDSQLAEIFGILNGDGHICRKEVCVVGNINEIDYYTYLKKLFEDKFGISFTLLIDKRQNSFKIRTYSIDLSNELRTKYGLPLGNKMGKLHIPISVLKDKTFGIPYLRGLFDTDGCFHVRRIKDPMISISSADPRYLMEVRRLLESLGFKVSKGDNRIFIYSKEMVNKFFKEVKPANTKHLKKYQEYIKLSAVS